MKNYKIINSRNLLHNLNVFSSKRVCAMVKANAYGHGIKQIVSILSDKVECFGVANAQEGAIVRKFTQKPIIVVGRTDEYALCKKYHLEIMVESKMDLVVAQKYGLEGQCHLKINCGMNRFGTKSKDELSKINDFLNQNNISLMSFFTHFSNTSNKRQTKSQYQRFCQLRAIVSQDAPVCLGGSDVINYPFSFQMIRVGIGLYGYENKNLLPVMSIVSHIVKIVGVRKGEYIGYGTKYRAKRDGMFAVVPIGYADGLKRALCGRLAVEINGKKYRAVGNICMDVFFVCVDRKVNVGDRVVVMRNAEILAKKCQTISYEILTGFSNLRGKTKIE